MGSPKVKAAHRENAKRLVTYAAQLWDAIGEELEYGAAWDKHVHNYARSVCTVRFAHSGDKLFDRTVRSLGWRLDNIGDVRLVAAILARVEFFYPNDPGPQRGKTKPRGR